MEPTRKDWTTAAVITPENHAAWEERFATSNDLDRAITAEIWPERDAQAAPGQPIPKELEPPEPCPPDEPEKK